MTARRDDESPATSTPRPAGSTPGTPTARYRNRGSQRRRPRPSSRCRRTPVSRPRRRRGTAGWCAAEQLIESYPISVDFDTALYQSDQNFELQGTVHMGQDVVNVRA